MTREAPNDPPRGLRVQDPEAWLAMSRGVRRAWLIFAVSFGLFLGAPGFVFFGAWPDWRWLGWVFAALGGVGLVTVGLVVRRWWNDPAPLARATARRIILIGAVAIVGTPLWYWMMVIPQL